MKKNIGTLMAGVCYTYSGVLVMLILSGMENVLPLINSIPGTVMCIICGSIWWWHPWSQK